MFIAGGVGINPFMSMLSSIKEGARPGIKVEVLYSLRDPGIKRVVEEMLFVERIKEALQELESPPCSGETLKLFLTRGTEERGMLDVHGLGVNFEGRRMDESDLLNALGPVEERIGTVVYICGPPAMTDGLVRAAKRPKEWITGMSCVRSGGNTFFMFVGVFSVYSHGIDLN